MGALGDFLGGAAESASKTWDTKVAAEEEIKRAERLAKVAAKIRREEKDYDERTSIIGEIAGDDGKAHFITRRGPSGESRDLLPAEIEARRLAKEEGALGLRHKEAQVGKSEWDLERAPTKAKMEDAEHTDRMSTNAQSRATSRESAATQRFYRENGGRSGGKRDTAAINRATDTIAREVMRMYPSEDGRGVDEVGQQILSELNESIFDPDQDTSPAGLQKLRASTIATARARKPAKP